MYIKNNYEGIVNFVGSVQEKHCFHIVFAEKIAYNDICISMGRGNERKGESDK